MAKRSFKRELPVSAGVLNQLDDGLCAGQAHVFRGLDERGQRRQRVFRQIQPVDCDHGAICGNAFLTVVERFDRGNCHHVGNGEYRGEAIVPRDQAARCLIDRVHIRKGARASDKVRVKRNSVFGKRVFITLKPQLADGVVAVVVGQNRNLFVP